MQFGVERQPQRMVVGEARVTHGSGGAPWLRRRPKSTTALDVRRVPPRESESVLILYDEHMIVSVDQTARVIVVSPPEGLLE